MSSGGFAARAQSAGDRNTASLPSGNHGPQNTGGSNWGTSTGASGSNAGSTAGRKA